MINHARQLPYHRACRGIVLIPDLYHSNIAVPSTQINKEPACENETSSRNPIIHLLASFSREHGK